MVSERFAFPAAHHLISTRFRPTSRISRRRTPLATPGTPPRGAGATRWSSAGETAQGDRTCPAGASEWEEEKRLVCCCAEELEGRGVTRKINPLGRSVLSTWSLCSQEGRARGVCRLSCRRPSAVVFALVILLALPLPSLAAGGYLEGYQSGQQMARTRTNGTSWLVGGFAGGFLLGLIGGGAVVLAASTSNQAPEYSLQTSLNDENEDYRRGYFEGYAREARSKNVTNALLGAGLGVVCAVLYVSSQDEEHYYAARPVLWFAF